MSIRKAIVAPTRASKGPDAQTPSIRQFRPRIWTSKCQTVLDNFLAHVRASHTALWSTLAVSLTVWIGWVRERSWDGFEGWPQITQRVANAAATRSMCYWLYHICRKQTSTTTGRMRAAMLGSFVRADLICRRAGKFFTPDERSSFSKAIESALLLNNWMACRAVAKNQKLFKILPKHHALTHCGFDYAVNPRSTQCYQDEDRRCDHVSVSCT